MSIHRDEGLYFTLYFWLVLDTCILFKQNEYMYFSNMCRHDLFITEHCHKETCLMPCENNTGLDQPAHSCSLICTFVVHCLDCRMAVESIFKISIP